MFYRDGILYRSDALAAEDVFHGFSTRDGGVSVLAHTKTMNLAAGRGDPDETVTANIRLFAAAAMGERGAAGAAVGVPSTPIPAPAGEPSEARLDLAGRVVTAPQIHSVRVRILRPEDGGLGVLRPSPVECDGFVTDRPGVYPLIRVADCVPILLLGRTANGAPVVGAVHAGWRGTVAGIAPEAVRLMTSLGAEIASVRAAVGPSIHPCCYEVGEDFLAAVRESRGEAFAGRFVSHREGRLFADLQGMNRFLLLSCGVPEDRIDVSPACTACRPEEFHSHRATGGKRGAMGAIIGIFG